MRAHEDDRRIAKKVLELKLARKEEIQDAGRILVVRADVGEPTSLDQILFEREVLSAGQVGKLQRALQLRTAHCPGCQARLNLWKEKPGAQVRCPSCKKAKVPVPGADREDPFKVAAARESARVPAKDSSGLVTLGLMGTLGVGGLLVDTAVESRGSHLMIPAAACAVGYGVLGPLLGGRLRWPTTAAIGVALYTGLVVASALGNGPGAPALVTLGRDAHQVLAPLVLFHLLLVLLASQAVLVRTRPILVLLGALPAVWGLLFFAWRSAPGADPAVWLAGPVGPLDRVPWYLHPGAVTLLGLFPLVGAAFLLAGLHGLIRGQPALLLRRVSVAASLLLLTGFGLAIGTARGRIPQPELEREVQTALAGRLAPFWTEAGPAPRGSTAAALSPAVAATPSAPSRR